MAKELDLGKVVGKDATINGKTAINLKAGKNIKVDQDDENVTISLDGEIDNEHFTDHNNPHQVTAEQVGVQFGTSVPKMDGDASTGSGTGYSREDHVHPKDTSKQDKLTGVKGQVVGFDASGNATAVNVDDSYLNPDIYGFELNLDETDPANKIRYIGKNADWGDNCFKINGDEGTGSCGAFENLWFIKNLKPVMLNYDGTVAYELNKNDYTQKAAGGASDVSNESFNGNAMMGIPTVWVKVDMSVPRKPKFYFAEQRIDASYHAFAHMDSKGNIMPYTYTPIYPGYKDSSGRIRSLSGKKTTRQETGTAQIEGCRKNNPSGSTIWDMEVTADRNLINLLLLLIGKSTNTQAIFGNGNMNGYNNNKNGTNADEYGVLNTGTMDKNGLFFGSKTSDNKGVKVFGMEHYWGNTWRRTQGLLLVNGKLLVKMTRGQHDGSKVDDYNSTGEGYIDTTVRLTGQTGALTSPDSDPYYMGFINDMLPTEYGLFPNGMDGTDTTDFADRAWYRTSNVRFALFGGYSSGGSYCGAFACALSNLVSLSTWDYGVAVSCKPLA